MDVSVISDYDYDSISKQLAEMQRATPESTLSETRYWYAFYDFDGNTGFHLSYRLSKDDFVSIGNMAHAVYTSWLEHLSPSERESMLKVKQASSSRK